MKCNNILEAIGGTLLVRLNRINGDLKPQIYVKADYTNPGGSVKDRIGITMIDEAEKKGLLKPGWHDHRRYVRQYRHGFGALVAAVRGYKMVFTTTDKQSKEKLDLLESAGRRSDCLPHGGRAGRPAQLLFRGEEACARNSQFVLPESV